MLAGEGRDVHVFGPHRFPSGEGSDGDESPADWSVRSVPVEAGLLESSLSFASAASSVLLAETGVLCVSVAPGLLSNSLVLSVS
ncbi:MAG: hypothetical protein JJ992_09090, partial [Planctomycetes bacterium]|nr:hypothetical protein [Planctomycetota bacterium]